MNLRANVHNFILVTVIAVLGLLLLKMLARTGISNAPVIGPLLQTAAAA